jgi:hypothetical protein
LSSVGTYPGGPRVELRDGRGWTVGANVVPDQAVVSSRAGRGPGGPRVELRDGREWTVGANVVPDQAVVSSRAGRGMRILLV